MKNVKIKAGICPVCGDLNRMDGFCGRHYKGTGAHRGYPEFVEIEIKVDIDKLPEELRPLVED